MVLILRHSIPTAPAAPPPTAGLTVPPPGAGVTGLSRTTYPGPSTITTAGTTVSRRNITGNILVLANNVVFSDCLITGVSGFAIDADSRLGLQVDHCTITSGSYRNNSCVLTGDNWQVTNCILMRYENAIMVQSGTGLCEGNYCHDLAGPGADPHVDGFQLAGPNTTGSTMIRGNWVESWDTSCIIIKTDGGSIANVTITGNTLINKPGQQTAACIYTYAISGRTVTNTVITNNRLQAGVGGYLANESATGTTWTGNIDYVTGATIPYPG